MFPWQSYFETYFLKHYARHLSLTEPKPGDNLYKYYYRSKPAMLQFISVNLRYDFVCLSGQSVEQYITLEIVFFYLLKLHNIHMLGAKSSMYNVVFVKVLQRGGYLEQKSDYAGLLAPSIENILL